MNTLKTAVTMIALVFIVSSPALAKDWVNKKFPHLRPMAVTKVEYPQLSGHRSFCERRPTECKPHEHEVAVLDKLSLGQLTAVNNAVNNGVKAANDLTLYDKEDWWDYPKGRGDCDEYVLGKYKKLVQLGWPKSSLLLTYVHVIELKEEDPNRYHLVLTASTDRGDFILDNFYYKNVVIPAADATKYYFVARQDATDGARWLTFDDSREDEEEHSAEVDEDAIGAFLRTLE